ncbi:MAG: hypothetical protein NC123_15960 [Butyrivibrio sp.]|nr:hypothetical protein [Butyrivibrio sp.]
MEQEKRQELDLSIARFIKEQWEGEEEEKKEQLRKKYDPKERITYTLEELIEGIRNGRQYLYTLLLEFESKELLDGCLTIPFIKDFYDVEQSENETVLLASNKRKVVFSVAYMPGTKAKASLDQWIAQTKEAMRDMHIYIKPGKKAVIGNLEYFCYVSPTAKGRLYNVIFRLQKGGRIYAGNFNCPEEEQKGMGMLLEAMVHVIEEMNR